MEKFTVRELATSGLIAAIYVVVSYLLAPISFGVYQVRVAEALTVLPFLTRAAIPGLFIGCLLANIFGGNGWIDIIFGSLLTLVAAILTRLIYHASKKNSGVFLAGIAIILIWISSIYLLSEFTLSGWFYAGIPTSLIGLIILFITRLKRDKNQLSITIAPILTYTGLLFVIISCVMFRSTESLYFGVIGLLLTATSVVATIYLGHVIATGKSSGILVAPLPPVIINALGVAAYLAPIIGTSYGFTVQMVGVGELISCYLIGIPLFLLLQKRNIFT